MTKEFTEKLSPFLHSKLTELAECHGEDSPRYLGLARQYLRDPKEGASGAGDSLKHYEAGLDVVDNDEALPGLERLYRRTLVIEPTLICSAHCRYCLRQNYAKHTLSEEQLLDIAKYCGSPALRDEVNEVLITGGDPLLVPRRLDFLLEALLAYAPNIRIVRIGTRLITQNPEKIDGSVLGIFQKKPSLRFEVATQINHPAELFPESREIIALLRAMGIKCYAQNVLLKGINDDFETLVELYDTLRLLDVEAHYLFHCCPIRGLDHLRTSLSRGIGLARALTSCGRLSGRGKPMFAAMTAIGKITFYDGAIASRRSNQVLLQSNYSLAERQRWNPSFRMPDGAELDAAGRIGIWYTDGTDKEPSA